MPFLVLDREKLLLLLLLLLEEGRPLLLSPRVLLLLGCHKENPAVPREKSRDRYLGKKATSLLIFLHPVGIRSRSFPREQAPTFLAGMGLVMGWG